MKKIKAKKILLVSVILITFIIFTVCDGKVKIKNEEPPFITELVQLVGKTNGDFKQLYDGPCYANSSAYRTKGWLTTDSGINIVFEDYGKWIWNNTNASKWQYSSNPFYDDLIIYSISVNAYYDGTQITNQDNLRKLFNTEEVITYEFLNKKLEQTPQTEQIDATNTIVPMNKNKLRLVVHDVYRCVYICEQYAIEVDFFDIDGVLTAQSASVSKAESNL